jgi:hypothetical protein
MVFMLGNLSKPSGSSKLDMVKWIRKRELQKIIRVSIVQQEFILKKILPF